MLRLASGTLLGCGLFLVPAKLKTKRRQELVSKFIFTAGTEAGIKRRAQHRSRNRFVDGGVDGPAALAGVGNAASEFGEVRAVEQREGSQIEEPRRDHAAATPAF